MISPRLDPDQITVGRIVSEARRLARQQGRITRAVRRLEAIGDARTDLLTKAAATILRNALLDPTTHHRSDLLAAALIVMAGADTEEIRDQHIRGQEPAQ